MSNDIRINQKLEDRILKGLLDYKKLYPSIVGCIDAGSFSTAYKSSLYRHMVKYWNEHKLAPTVDALKCEIESEGITGQVSLTVKTLDRIAELPKQEWSWLASKITTTIKIVNLQKAIYEASQYIQSDNAAKGYERGKKSIIDAITRSGLVSDGLSDELDISRESIIDLFDDDTTSFCCPTRIPPLDSEIQGLFRKELLVCLAPLNIGKSWFMMHIAVNALLSGKAVLYFTCEMSAERVRQRILTNICGLVSPNGDSKMREMNVKRLNGVEDEYPTDEIVKFRTHKDIDFIESQLKFLKRFGGALSIREYPSGACSTANIRQDFDGFDVGFNRPPDVVIVDGLGDLRYDSMSEKEGLRFALSKATKELRSLASEENCAVVASTQTNRQGLKSEHLGAHHVGESLGIMQVCDTAIALSQSSNERQYGIMQLKVIRARNQRRDGAVEIFQDLGAGQFHLNSRFKRSVKGDG